MTLSTLLTHVFASSKTCRCSTTRKCRAQIANTATFPCSLVCSFASIESVLRQQLNHLDYVVSPVAPMWDNCHPLPRHQTGWWCHWGSHHCGSLRFVCERVGRRLRCRRVLLCETLLPTLNKRSLAHCWLVHALARAARFRRAVPRESSPELAYKPGGVTPRVL